MMVKEILHENFPLRQRILPQAFDEKLLHSIVQGTYSIIGDDFFRSAVSQLASVLNFKHALIAERLNLDNSKMQTLAFWSCGQFIDNMEYELAGTPCEKVMKGMLCYYPTKVQKLFPHDKELADLKVDSYLGAPFYDSKGNLTGHLVVMDDKPMYDSAFVMSVFKIFASRAGAELERKHMEKLLQNNRNQLEQIVDQRTAELKQTNRRLEEEFRVQKEMEENLRRTNMFLDLIIETIPNMIFIKDAKDLRFVRFNKAVEEVVGLPKEKMIGKNDYDFFPKEQADFFTKKDREVLEQKNVCDIPEEPIYTKKRGLRYLHTKKIPILDKNGNPLYLLGISEDITERKRAKSKEQELQSQLLQAEKLSSIGLLAAGVAHELNNPLTGLISLIRTYRKRRQQDSEDYNDLTEMLQASNHMAKIIEDLNAFSRASKGGFKKLDLHEVIESTLSFSQHLFKHNNIEIKKAYSHYLPGVLGDKPQLQQVILNLLTNAKDAMTDGGTLTIRTRTSQSRDMVYLVFRDTGMGIGKEDVDKIFDPFFTTKVVGEGVGLGLSVMHGIIQRHKGTISVKSESHKGTKFIISLPACGQNQ